MATQDDLLTRVETIERHLQQRNFGAWLVYRDTDLETDLAFLCAEVRRLSAQLKTAEDIEDDGWNKAKHMEARAELAERRLAAVQSIANAPAATVAETATHHRVYGIHKHVAELTAAVACRARAETMDAIRRALSSAEAT